MDPSFEIVAGVYLGGTPAEQRSLLETNLPLNDPSVWEEVFGDYVATDAGIKVNEDTALMYAPLWQGVNLIASVAAGIPFHHHRWLPEISDTANVRVRNSTQDYLVSVSPSGGIEPDDYCTAMQFWESFWIDVLLWGNGFAYIVFDGSGRPIQLRLLNPDRTTCEMIEGRLWYMTEFNSERQPQMKTLFPWEVIHVRGLCPDGHKAPRFIRYARNAIALGLAQQKFASKFFNHGGRVGGILELPLGMPKTARDSIEEGFRKSYEGADNPFKTVILRDSAKFHSAQTTPEGAQMVEGTEEQARMIARFLGLSPALLGVKDSTSYNSKEQDNQAFLDHCLKRWLRKLQQECGLKLLSAQRQTKEFFTHDVSDLISMNALQQAQAFQLYQQMTVLSPNEIRGKLNLLPREGGDEYQNPNTSSPLATEPTEDEPDEPEAPDEAPPPEAKSTRDWKVLRVLFNLTHVARQKAKNHRAFMEWLEGGFRSQRDEWREIAGEEPEPQFFVDIAADFNAAVGTVTPVDLPAKVEQITATFEKDE